MAGIRNNAKAGLSIRQRKLIKARVEGKTLTEAAKVAGYACKQTAGEALQNLTANGKACAALERAGLSDERLAEKASALLDAKKPFGKHETLYEDGGTQLSTLEYVAKIKGSFAPTKTDVKGEVNLIPVMDLIEQLRLARTKKAIGHDEAV